MPLPGVKTTDRRDPYARAAGSGYAQSPQPKIRVHSASRTSSTGARIGSAKKKKSSTDPVTAAKTAILLGRIPEDAALPAAYVTKKQTLLGEAEKSLKQQLAQVDAALGRLAQKRNVKATVQSIDASMQLMDQVDTDSLQSTVTELKGTLQQITKQTIRSTTNLVDDLDDEISRIREGLTNAEVTATSQIGALQSELDDCEAVLQGMDTCADTLHSLRTEVSSMGDVSFLSQFKQCEKEVKQVLTDVSKLPGSLDMEGRTLSARATAAARQKQHSNFHTRLQALEARLAHIQQARRTLSDKPPELPEPTILEAGKKKPGPYGRVPSAGRGREKKKKGASKKPVPRRGRITRPQYDTLERQYQALRTEFELFKSRGAQHCDNCKDWEGKAVEVKSRLRVLSQYHAAHTGESKMKADGSNQRAQAALERERTAANIAATLVPALLMATSTKGGKGKGKANGVRKGEGSKTPTANGRDGPDVSGTDSPHRRPGSSQSGRVQLSPLKRKSSTSNAAGSGRKLGSRQSSRNRIIDVEQVGVCDASSHGAVRSLAFNPVHAMAFALGSLDGTVSLWHMPAAAASPYPIGETDGAADVPPCQLSVELPGHEDTVNGLCYHPDGRVLVSVSDDCTFKLWDAIARKEKPHFASPSKSPVTCVAFDATGARLALGSYKDVHVWAFNTWQLLHVIKAHELNVYCVDFHPTLDAVLSCGDDCTVKVWDLSSKAATCVDVDATHSSWVWSARFTPDGDSVISASQDRTVRVRDWQMDKTMHTLTAHRDTVYGLAVSRTVAVSACQDGTLRVWDWTKGVSRYNIRAHIGSAYAVTLCPAYSVLVSGGADGQAKLWRYPGGDLIGTAAAPLPPTSVNGAAPLTPWPGSEEALTVETHMLADTTSDVEQSEEVREGVGETDEGHVAEGDGDGEDVGGVNDGEDTADADIVRDTQAETMDTDADHEGIHTGDHRGGNDAVDRQRDDGAEGEVRHDSREADEVTTRESAPQEHHESAHETS